MNELNITVNRPDGKKEVIDLMARYGNYDENTFANKIYPKIKDATEKAGKGEVISYFCKEEKNIKINHISKCVKCGIEIDTRISLKEIIKYNGINVTHFYCVDCGKLINETSN